ncbi:MAG: CtsR family transcriptional regulator [Clostridia bacterium]|nr:CtsR family transcriptional regulator [Clostridia bacterium]
MNLSNVIAQMIYDMLTESGEAEIQRNTLAENLGCVPSQINYVISSRFTPERGYSVESRRGGGGYIRITRISCENGAMLMHVINSIGDSLDENTCRAHIRNLLYQKLLNEDEARLLLAASGEGCYRQLPPQIRGRVRATVIKQMLLSCQK